METHVTTTSGRRRGEGRRREVGGERDEGWRRGERRRGEREELKEGMGGAKEKK